MPEIIVTVTRNNVPTVVPCYWETFANNREARCEVARNDWSSHSLIYTSRTKMRLERGNAKCSK